MYPLSWSPSCLLIFICLHEYTSFSCKDLPQQRKKRFQTPTDEWRHHSIIKWAWFRHTHGKDITSFRRPDARTEVFLVSEAVVIALFWYFNMGPRMSNWVFSSHYINAFNTLHLIWTKLIIPNIVFSWLLSLILFTQKPFTSCCHIMFVFEIVPYYCCK